MFWMIDRSNVKLSREDDPQERRLLDWYCDKIIAKINNTKGKVLITILEPIVYMTLLILTTAYLIDASFNPFLYFRF